MANLYSSGDWQLEQPVAMALPSIGLKPDRFPTRAAGFLLRRIALQPLVRAPAVIISLIQLELSLQVQCSPKGQMIQVFPADAPDQPFDEPMRPGNLRHRLDSLHSQDSEIGLPALKLEEGIVVEAQPDGQSLTRDRLIEHATKGHAVHGNRLHAKTDDAPAELIHNDQDPMRTKQDRFGPEQVQAPKAVLGVTQNRQPRRPALPPIQAIVPGQNAADDIFVDFQAEGLGQVLRNPGAAKTRIAAFEFTDDLDLCGRGPFGPRPALGVGGVKQPVFEISKRTMKAEQGGGAKDDGRAEEAAWTEER